MCWWRRLPAEAMQVVKGVFGCQEGGEFCEAIWEVRGQRTGLAWGHLGVRERDGKHWGLWPTNTDRVVGHGQGG